MKKKVLTFILLLLSLYFIWMVDNLTFIILPDFHSDVFYIFNNPAFHNIVFVFFSVLLGIIIMNLVPFILIFSALLFLYRKKVDATIILSAIYMDLLASMITGYYFFLFFIFSLLPVLYCLNPKRVSFKIKLFENKLIRYCVLLITFLVPNVILYLTYPDFLSTAEKSYPKKSFFVELLQNILSQLSENYLCLIIIAITIFIFLILNFDYFEVLLFNIFVQIITINAFFFDLLKRYEQIITRNTTPYDNTSSFHFINFNSLLAITIILLASYLLYKRKLASRGG